jgi:Thioredoxin reductase
MYDIAVIGSGPAGLSAAITIGMRNLSSVVISPPSQSGWLNKTKEISNYPGMPNISGQAMLSVFKEQAAALGAKTHSGLVRQILPHNGAFMLLVENELIEARAVILAMGAARPKLLAGEEDLVGNGVSYCATCDGMLYRGKKIALLSADIHGVQEANFLMGLTASVSYYTLKKHETTALDNRIIQLSATPSALKKENNEVFVDDLPYDGVFIIRPAVSLTQLMHGLALEEGFIPVNRRMETNLPGVYAAGDCTGQPLQIAKAVGEGNIAAICACEYLQSGRK